MDTTGSSMPPGVVVLLRYLDPGRGRDDRLRAVERQDQWLRRASASYSGAAVSAMRATTCSGFSPAAASAARESACSQQISGRSAASAGRRTRSGAASSLKVL